MQEEAASKKITYNKLIRDLIPEIIGTKGKAFEVTTMENGEYQHALKQKILEEAKEVVEASSQKELITELADLYEVIDTLAALHHISEEEIRVEQLDRRMRRGGFEKRLKLLWAEG